MLKLIAPLVLSGLFLLTPACAENKPGATPQTPTTAEQRADKFCKLLGDFAEDSANSREREMPLSVALDIMNQAFTNQTPNIMATFRRVLIFTYKKTWLNPREIRQRVEVACHTNGVLN